MQTPSIGRVVIVPADPASNNGATEAPAVITRVWAERPDGSWTINVRQLLDGDATKWKTSLALYDDETAAMTSPGVGTQDLIAGPAHVAWWPPRVP